MTKTDLQLLEERLEAKMDAVALSHEKKVKICLDKMSDRFEEKIDSLVDSAFPSGDPLGHKNYHQTQIDWMRLRNDFIREIVTHMAKAGLLGGMAWIVYACWQLALFEIKK